MITPRWLGVVRHDLARCGSTNDEADALARRGAPHGTIVVADEQTAGRGRADHAWYSPPGESLYLSCVLRPSLPPSEVPPITLAAGVAVCDAVNSWGARASLDWPNDVLSMQRKLAGILTEMSSRDGKVEHVVLGVGVNLNTVAFPPALAGIATSLRLALGGRRVDRAAFTAALLQRLETWLDRFFAGGIAAISAAWTERSGMAGRRVRADGVVGRARGLDADGALLVEDDGGALRRVVAGDVAVL
jgi:BirA family biotin operon repressor/biotin-[acetyl-CoA-carboxylase] ligase